MQPEQFETTNTSQQVPTQKAHQRPPMLEKPNQRNSGPVTRSMGSSFDDNVPLTYDFFDPRGSSSQKQERGSSREEGSHHSSPMRLKLKKKVSSKNTKYTNYQVTRSQENKEKPNGNTSPKSGRTKKIKKQPKQEFTDGGSSWNALREATKNIKDFFVN